MEQNYKHFFYSYLHSMFVRFNNVHTLQGDNTNIFRLLKNILYLDFNHNHYISFGSMLSILPSNLHKQSQAEKIVPHIYLFSIYLHQYNC